MSQLRPFRELSESGLLWLINRTVFHPQGYALGIRIDSEENAVGWELLGDGSEPFVYGGDGSDEVEQLQAARETLRRAAENN